MTMAAGFREADRVSVTHSSFADEYAEELLKIARREVGGKHLQTPQDAALELLDIAVESLSSLGRTLPEPIRDYLHHALREIQDGKNADVALGIKRATGRQPLDDVLVKTIIAHYALKMRRGSTPLEAKKAVLLQAESLWDGGRTMDWIDDLLAKHMDKDKAHAIGLLTDEELESLADFNYLIEAGIK